VVRSDNCGRAVSAHSATMYGILNLKCTIFDNLLHLLKALWVQFFNNIATDVACITVTLQQLNFFFSQQRKLTLVKSTCKNNKYCDGTGFFKIKSRQTLYFTSIKVAGFRTRKLCYRKDDCAMHNPTIRT